MISALIQFLVFLLVVYIFFRITLLVLNLFKIPVDGPVLQIIQLIFLLIVIGGILNFLGFVQIFPVYRRW